MKNAKRSILVALCLGAAAATQVTATEAVGPECTDPEVSTLIEATLEEPLCELVCECEQRTTKTFTRAGATCQRAKDNAIAAALSEAVCDAGEESCGATLYFVSNCFINSNGKTAAQSFANYSCEVCEVVCGCLPCKAPPCPC